MNDEQNLSASNASTDKPEAQPINDLQAAEINSNLLVENPVTQKPGHKETIEPVQPETINPKLQTEEMEVHHHGHVHEKKKWIEYLFQFFMLFLAVFCGFLAEYQLEHKIEKDREKQFIQSLIEDLQQDQQTLEEDKKRHEKSDMIADTLIKLLMRPDLNNTSELYYYCRVAVRHKVLTSNRRTIEQMQNSGGFRLIRNSEAAKQIITHYNQFDLIRRLEDIELNHQNEYRSTAIKIFDPETMSTTIGKDNIIIRPKGNPPLRTYDTNLLTDMAGRLQYMKTTRIALQVYKNDLTKSGNKLISFLKQEYHLE
jgi:hypothetical protein